MALFTKPAVDVFAAQDSGGNARSVVNADAQTWGTEMEALSALVEAGALGSNWKATKALLDADLAHDAGTAAVVYADSTNANNGFYVKSGASGAGSWTQVTTFLPGYQFVSATDDGSSTANAYTMDTSPQLPAGDGVALVSFVVPVTNTDTAVTVSFDGSAPVTIKTASGSAPAIGGLVAGMPVFGVVVGSEFRMRSDQSSSVTAAQVQADADRAEAAANSVDFVTADAPDDIAALDLTLKPSLPAINVLGYPTSPGARHDWVRAASEPAHSMKEQSLDGQWWEISPFTVHAEHFGAWGHNQLCADALDNAMQFLIENQHGTIILPAGRAILDRSLVKTIGATTEDNLFTVRGNGRGSTFLQVDAASLPTGDVLGFHQASLGINNRVTFRDFTMVADGVVDGYALVADRPAGGISKDPLLDVFNVSVYGKDFSDDCFTGGLNASGSLYPNIQWFAFNGAQNQGSTDYSDSSLFFTADTAINLDETYGGWLFQCITKFSKIGLSDIWTSGPAGEGIYVDRCNFVIHQVCLKYARNPAEPSNKISGCHFHYRDVGLWVEGSFGSDYSDSSFYNQLTGETVHSASPIANTAIDFYSKDAYDLDLDRNRHRGQDGNNRVLYYFDGGTNTTVDVEINRPIIEGCDFTNLVRAFIGQKVEINDPVITANSTNTGGLLGGNHAKQDVGINYRGKKKLTRLSITADFSIPNNVVTAIGWNSEQSDDLGLHANSPNPTRITIPARQGIRKVKITANVQFASDDTGTRQLALYMNGATVQGGFSTIAAATTAGIERLNGVSDWIDVTDNDYFEVMVYQNSGAALNAVAGNQTWASVEVA